MSNIDMSLDDMINKDSNKRGGTRRVVSGRAPGGRQGTRTARSNAAAPYTRGGRRAGEADHMANTDVRDVAASKNPTLKVSSTSKPNTVAGAICNVVRESQTGQPPSILATGPQAINQAIKAIAIARKYLLEEEGSPTDILVSPKFEQDVRSGSNVSFDIRRSPVIGREPTEDDLSAKDKTDAFKLAGAIAGRVRDGQDVAITTKGPVPVLVAIKAISLAQDYVADESLDIKFAVQFRDLEDPELRNTPSTYLHFAIVARAI